MAKHSHLTLQERSIICARIAQGASFRQIGAELDKDPGTISKEIQFAPSQRRNWFIWLAVLIHVFTGVTVPRNLYA